MRISKKFNCELNEQEALALLCLIEHAKWKGAGKFFESLHANLDEALGPYYENDFIAVWDEEAEKLELK